jgi:galactose-1-phosphate uridylyltransferase
MSIKKPNSLMNKDVQCPFCHFSNTDDIIDAQGSISLVRNIFPVFENAYQAVIIENDNCDLDIPTYSKEYLVQLLQFSFSHWQEMISSNKYKSVIFYKNHGVYSGGSLKHPHMQLIGLYDIDYNEKIKEEYFEGLLIHSNNGVHFNVSTMPIGGSVEFNIIMQNKENFYDLAEYLQKCTDYILNHFNTKGQSFNLFFYEFNDSIIVKIVSRTVTSPYLVGYLIPQVSSNLSEIAEFIQKNYFS